ncbi:hypothetical protein [Lactiplantibacillus plantarum]|uniref:hypothetical protein n=1 Tax=Lactiplantibacillus plantarum TaxID=1590 RepID=UPI00097718E7|nr:hypothetical protein [Lactiplantibacillus plantarum]
MNMSEILQNSLAHTKNVYKLFFSNGHSIFVTGPLAGIPHDQNTLPLTANRTDEAGKILSSVVFEPSKVDFFYIQKKS